MDEDALRAFVQHPPHVRLMAALAPHMGETEFVRWTVKGSLLGDATRPPANTVNAKRIQFVEDILRNCIKTLDRDFRKSRIPQMKGFSLKPEKDLRKRRKS